MDNNKFYWLLSSYPRSGNTWCRIFISEVLRIKKEFENKDYPKYDILKKNLDLNKDLNTGFIISDRNWLDDQLGITSSDLTFSELDQVRKDININKSSNNEKSIFHKVHDAFYIKDSLNVPVVSTKNFKGVVYIIRNPFDVAVSLKHFFSWDQQRTVEFLLDKNAEISGSKKYGNIQCRQFLGTWENHYLSWANQTEIPILLIRYEDLYREPIKYFYKISLFLNLTEDKSLVENAVSNITFKKISSLEDSLGGFKENLNYRNKFFRSGKVGEGKKFLSKKQINSIKSSFINTLEKIYKEELNIFFN